MSTPTHPNSKKVTIYRAGSFIDDAQTNAKEYLALSNKSISSYWAKSSSKAIGSGLDFNEIDLLLPRVLDVPAEDRTFRDKVREFYASIITRVPFETGKELEIGLLVDNSQPVTYVDATGKKNLPIDLDDYLHYRHALTHPRVARNLDTAKGNKLIEFYIFDKDDDIASKSKTASLKDEALTAYFDVKKDAEKVNMMLTLLGTDPRDFVGKNAVELREQALRAKADGDASKFLKVYKTDNFKVRYTIQAMINANILKQVGNQYINGETNTVIASDLEQMLFWMQDPKHSQDVSMLKTLLQEANRELTKSTEKKAVVSTEQTDKD